MWSQLKLFMTEDRASAFSSKPTERTFNLQEKPLRDDAEILHLASDEQAAGTLNSYHLVLGRCLLAVHRTKLYKAFACSGAVHYGTLVLGLGVRKARALPWVADKLEELPQLSRSLEAGEVNWSKVREIVRKATDETEAFWLEIARRRTYREITALLGCPGGSSLST